MLYGVGYHHAGMDISDRKAIEAMFTTGDLPVLCEEQYLKKILLFGSNPFLYVSTPPLWMLQLRPALWQWG